MQTKNSDRQRVIRQFEKLKQILFEGQKLGIDTTELIQKIENVIKALKDNVLRIVLMGSFSDGKTSAIAGLLGKLNENMKIDQDESSDELTFYHFEGTDNIEIIDTPGLFGTKEKEIDGKSIKYSDITKKYISEANIIIYVCDAVTPLKDSHVGIIRKVLRDFGKLKSTIFVLNKMDEAGFDTLDKIDYNRGTIIKTNALISRLKETIDLTEEEQRELNIVCISADPKGKGLEYWLSKMDSYKKRSHIDLLDATIKNIVESNDTDDFKNETNSAVISDIVSEVNEQVSTSLIPIEKSLIKVQDICAELEQDRSGLRLELMAAKARLLKELQNLEAQTNIDINESDKFSILNLIENKLGLVDGKIDYHILDSNIEQAISFCVESNNFAILNIEKPFEQKLSLQEIYIKDALKLVANNLRKVNITNIEVLAIRDSLGKHFMWAKNIKFKPHGAEKLAAKITKGAQLGTIGIGLVLDLWAYLKERKEAKKLLEFKNELKSNISNKFKKVYSVLNNDKTYFKEFAPSYNELCNTLDERNRELQKFQEQTQSLRQFNNEIENWLNNH